MLEKSFISIKNKFKKNLLIKSNMSLEEEEEKKAKAKELLNGLTRNRK